MHTVAVYSTSSIWAAGLGAILPKTFSAITLFRSLDVMQEQLPVISPDLLVLDMTPTVSFGALRRIGSGAPASRLIVWSDTISPEFVSQCFAAGARGVLLKSASVETHVGCLTQVAEVGFWIDPTPASNVFDAKPMHLSSRERQLISLIVQGVSNKTISWILGITVGTTKVYLSRLYEKLRVGDRLELAMLALKNMPIPADIETTTVKVFAFPDTIWVGLQPLRKTFPHRAIVKQIRTNKLARPPLHSGVQPARAACA
jgi:DNA-binding NarL/FixJ family response regulator